MFIDELQFHIKAGDGGDGVVRWRHIKGKDLAGPCGGNGGRGGDTFVVGASDAGLLLRYRNEKEFKAKNGGDGESNSRHGADGDDLVLELPIGSIIKNLNTNESVELLEVGEKVKILSGGRGGRGNETYKSSTNQSPTEFTLGELGEDADFLVELKLIADVGLIGLPNAGKSTLLNSLTGAGAKVGNYAFTTLDPNLGAYYGKIIADLPGLIEGAADGKGLGHKFLKHVSRTRVLVHCVALDSQDLISDYRAVRDELGAYDEELIKKKEILILTKSDSVEPIFVEKIVDSFKKEGVSDCLVVSVLDRESIKKLGQRILKELN